MDDILFAIAAVSVIAIFVWNLFLHQTLQFYSDIWLDLILPACSLLILSPVVVWLGKRIFSLIARVTVREFGEEETEQIKHYILIALMLFGVYSLAQTPGHISAVAVRLAERDYVLTRKSELAELDQADRQQFALLQDKAKNAVRQKMIMTLVHEHNLESEKLEPRDKKLWKQIQSRTLPKEQLDRWDRIFAQEDKNRFEEQ